ncbi:hypothetical protein BRARA_K00031 [Brassica rapa]|uniref:DUF1421 domain-containing protein n=2 Tax=Brassica TaxID=3705 RepID=M4E607_BRACM|nr:basic salivary proline-rich protein 1 [Brassica rapa]XP_013692195.2 basic salivary proline-rich protein 1 [Brassica napus]RIA05513.1 hypothetical protein BRARA_K00031 [Brassica rapa]CAF2131786.1 unnamed protein product [Brassica napus]CDY29896.1 BnaA03g49170D [Brassica napus]
MASGRVNSGFDFGSDDILRTYDDFTNNQDSSNGSNSDPSIAATNNFNKEFHKTRMARSSVFPTSSYSPPEDSLSQDVTATVERTMKKYTDNVMRFLEGISSRLSQLELYCYNLDKTIGEMRSDLTRDNEEADVKLRSMEKHLQEVRRSVQILRDKQELADTQKDLARLQVVQKDSSSPSHSQKSEETPVPEAKKTESSSDAHNQQLALALPHQIPPAQPQPQPQQQQQYYMSPTPQLQNTPAPVPAPPSQPQAPPAQAQFMPPPPAPSHPSSAQTQSFPQYQQNWPPQPQARPQSSGGYPTYSPAPPSNQSPVEPSPGSMQMPSPYGGPPQQSMQGYGYSAPPPPPQAPQQTKMSYSHQTGDAYVPSGPPPPPGYANAMYEGGRMQYPPPQPPPPQQQQGQHYMQGPQGGGYAPQQHQAGGGSTGTPSPVMRSKYGELIEKLVSMGFRGDHVMSVIQRMEESGQPIDFNALLDRLSVQSSGGPPRGW